MPESLSPQNQYKSLDDSWTWASRPGTRIKGKVWLVVGRVSCRPPCNVSTVHSQVLVFRLWTKVIAAFDHFHCLSNKHFVGWVCVFSATKPDSTIAQRQRKIHKNMKRAIMKVMTIRRKIKNVTKTWRSLHDLIDKFERIPISWCSLQMH